MFTPTRITRQKDNVPIRSNIPQVNLFQENGSQRSSIHAQFWQKRQDAPSQNVFLLSMLSLTPSHSSHSGPGYSKVLLPIKLSKYSSAQQLLGNPGFLSLSLNNYARLRRYCEILRPCICYSQNFKLQLSI